MQILYTNSSKPNVEQLDPNISIGGNISSSIVPNDYLGNLFSLVTKSTIVNKKREVKLLALKNETLVQHTAITLAFTLPTDGVFNYKFAIVSPTLDNCDNEVFEKLSNQSSLPYYATFTQIVSATVYNVPININASKSIGLWLIRELKSDVDIEALDYFPKSCQDFKDLNVLIETNQTIPSLPEQELITLDISWT